MSDVAIQNSRKHGTPISLDCVANARNNRKANPLTPNPLPEGEGAIVSELANYTSAGEGKRKTAFTRFHRANKICHYEAQSNSSVEDVLCSESLQHANVDKMLNMGKSCYPQRPVLQHDRHNVKAAMLPSSPKGNQDRHDNKAALPRQLGENSSSPKGSQDRQDNEAALPRQLGENSSSPKGRQDKHDNKAALPHSNITVTAKERSDCGSPVNKVIIQSCLGIAMRSGLDSLSSLWLGKARNPRIPELRPSAIPLDCHEAKASRNDRKANPLTPNPSPIGRGEKMVHLSQFMGEGAIVSELANYTSAGEGKRKCAFTLAEVLITLTILGVVAALTVPSVVHKNQERINKTRVKKAMAIYENGLKTMVIENNLRSDDMVTTWAGEVDNCGNTTRYFKKVSGDGCIFKTADGVWWNIENIQKPMIAFKEENLTDEKAKDQHDKTAYYMVGHFGSNGELRINDNGWEHSQKDNDENIYIVRKLWSVLGIEPQHPLSVTFCSASNCIKYIYDGNGRMTIRYINCDLQGKNCQRTDFFGGYDEYGNYAYYTRECTSVHSNSLCNKMMKFEYDYETGNGSYLICNNDGSNCKKDGIVETNDKGQLTTWYYGCTNPDNKNTCKYSYQHQYDDNGNIIWYKSTLDNVVYKYEYDDKGNVIKRLDCDINGNNCKENYKYSYEY